MAPRRGKINRKSDNTVRTPENPTPSGKSEEKHGALHLDNVSCGSDWPSEMPSRLSLQREKRSVLSGLPCSLVSSAWPSPWAPSAICRFNTWTDEGCAHIKNTTRLAKTGLKRGRTSQRKNLLKQIEEASFTWHTRPYYFLQEFTSNRKKYNILT